jgi:aspartyl/asparaginyl-tRNA synthetase
MGDIISLKVLQDSPDQYMGKVIKVAGWAKTTRSAENDTIKFIEINDGSA